MGKTTKLDMYDVDERSESFIITIPANAKYMIADISSNLTASKRYVSYNGRYYKVLDIDVIRSSWDHTVKDWSKLLVLEVQQIKQSEVGR